MPRDAGSRAGTTITPGHRDRDRRPGRRAQGPRPLPGRRQRPSLPGLGYHARDGAVRAEACSAACPPAVVRGGPPVERRTADQRRAQDTGRRRFNRKPAGGIGGGAPRHRRPATATPRRAVRTGGGGAAAEAVGTAEAWGQALYAELGEDAPRRCASRQATKCTKA